MGEPAGVRARIAVVGIGNTLAGDDGVGVEVVRRLSERWGDRGTSCWISSRATSSR